MPMYTPVEYIIDVQGQRSLERLDRVGAVASAICAVHCLLTGVALGLLGTFGFAFLGSIWADVIFIGIALLVGTLAILSGFRRHQSYVPGLVFFGSLGLLSVAFFVMPERSMGHTLFAVTGGLGLVSFHLLNSRMQCSTPRSV